MVTAESQVINSILKNKDINILFGSSTDDLFVAYRDVWDSIKGYYNRYHTVPDISIIQERFPDLEEVAVSGPTEHYFDRLQEQYIENRVESLLTTAGKKLSTDSSKLVLNKLQAELAKLNRFSSSAKDLNVMDFEEAERHYDDVRARAEAMGGTPGIPTGIDFFDSAYPSGLAGGDLVVVLGWTGRAKSLFTTLVSCNAHTLGYKPMICSLEMSGEKVRDRIWTIKGSGLFTNSGLALGDIEVDSMEMFRKQNEHAPEFIVVTNDGSTELTPNVLQAKVDQYKPNLLVFDYAQLGSDNNNSQDMTARMRNMSKEYKRLAVNNDIPVMLISSATADSSAATDSAPRVEQVAWSKQLAFDADLAVAVHKFDDSNLIDITCRKNRNGPLFRGMLTWDIDNGKIVEGVKDHQGN